MECYAHGYPAPRLSWYKEVDPNNPTALIPLTEKSFKYKFEATIPEPDVCTDCILARITVINVISGDYGTYVLRATSEQSIGYSSEGRVRLYRNFNFFSCIVVLNIKYYSNSYLFKKLPNASNLSPIRTTKAAAVRPKLSRRQFSFNISHFILLLFSFKIDLHNTRKQKPKPEPEQKKIFKYDNLI